MSLGERPPEEVSLFYGPPEGLEEQVPRDGGWDLIVNISIKQPNHRLLCKYRGTRETVTIILPRGLIPTRLDPFCMGQHQGGWYDMPIADKAFAADAPVSSRSRRSGDRVGLAGGAASGAI